MDWLYYAQEQPMAQVIVSKPSGGVYIFPTCFAINCKYKLLFKLVSNDTCWH